MSRRLIFVRHARVGAEHVGRLIGSSDVPLDAVGLRQAAALADRVRAIGYDQCYASPLLRCRQTLEAIWPAAAGQFVDDLREIDFGRWEKHTFDQAAAEAPALAEQWAAFDPELTFPGGENLGRFLLRVQTAAERLTTDEADTVLVVSHGGVIRVMLCYLLGCDPRRYMAFGFGYGAFAVVDVYGQHGVLTRLEPCEICGDADG